MYIHNGYARGVEDAAAIHYQFGIAFALTISIYNGYARGVEDAAPYA